MRKRRKDFRWRYQPTNEQDMALLDYLQNYPVASTTEVIMSALRAYWLPIALAHEPKFDIVTKQQIASKYAHILRYQADAICQAVGIASSSISRSRGLTIREQSQPVQSIINQKEFNSLSGQQLLQKEAGTGFSTEGLSKWIVSD